MFVAKTTNASMLLVKGGQYFVEAEGGQKSDIFIDTVLLFYPRNIEKSISIKDTKIFFCKTSKTC